MKTKIYRIDFEKDEKLHLYCHVKNDTLLLNKTYNKLHPPYRYSDFPATMFGEELTSEKVRDILFSLYKDAHQYYDGNGNIFLIRDNTNRNGKTHRFGFMCAPAIGEVVDEYYTKVFEKVKLKIFW